MTWTASILIANSPIDRNKLTNLKPNVNKWLTYSKIVLFFISTIIGSKMIEWYEIKLGPDCYGRHGEPAFSFKLQKQIEDWIVEQYQMDSEPWIWRNDKFLVYEFTSEMMAMAFKLRWG